MQNRRNYYRILHVQPDAPTEIIRMSYVTLMQRLGKHPDLGGDHEEAALINEAFATLIDPERRAVYDRELALARALPGYRSRARRREDAATPSRATEPAGHANACAFCGVACSAGDRKRPDAVCAACASPLRPPDRVVDASAARRAIARLPKRMAITFYLAWPHPGFSGTTRDLSPHGMRFTSAVNLMAGERIKIDCAVCSAVAVVRHSRETPGQPGTWEAGVEFLTLRLEPTRGVLLAVDA